MISVEEARARVARGAAHLDTVRPGWWNQIDVGTLTLHDPCGCIVGQLCPGTNFNNFHARFERLTGDRTLLGSVHHGMDVRYSDYAGGDARDAFALVQNAWVEVIADRRLREVETPEPVAVEAR